MCWPVSDLSVVHSKGMRSSPFSTQCDVNGGLKVIYIFFFKLYSDSNLVSGELLCLSASFISGLTSSPNDYPPVSDLLQPSKLAVRNKCRLKSFRIATRPVIKMVADHIAELFEKLKFDPVQSMTELQEVYLKQQIIYNPNMTVFRNECVRNTSSFHSNIPQVICHWFIGRSAAI